MSEIHHHKSHSIIKSFEAEALRKRPLVVKIADFLTSYFGTVSFLVINVIIYGFWVYINIGKVPGILVFDPYPFSLMNSFVSIEAIFLTVIVLMSQNRESQRDVLRNELGLQVELISEKEITKILKLLKIFLATQKNTKFDHELEDMTQEMDAGYIERKLEEQLENNEGSTISEIGREIKQDLIPQKPH